MVLVAVLDANVLYPGSLRDLLIRLGQTDLFRARWTERILDEMVDAIVAAQPELAERLGRTRQLMNEAIPDVCVTGYEHLVGSLQLPDPNDRHVLAAAIRAEAQTIVTKNLKDFPADVLEPYSIEAQGPDDFVLRLLEVDPARVVGIIGRSRRDPDGDSWHDDGSGAGQPARGPEPPVARPRCLASVGRPPW